MAKSDLASSYRRFLLALGTAMALMAIIHWSMRLTFPPFSWALTVYQSEFVTKGGTLSKAWHFFDIGIPGSILALVSGYVFRNDSARHSWIAAAIFVGALVGLLPAWLAMARDHQAVSALTRARDIAFLQREFALYGVIFGLASWFGWLGFHKSDRAGDLPQL